MDKENIKKGNFLKKVRTANLLSEKELAKMLEVEPSDITVWETGIKFPEDSETLDRLSKALQVSKKELLNGEFKKDKKIENSLEVEYTEEVEKEEPVTTGNKNAVLVVLSCMVLFILVITVVSIMNGKTKSYTPVERIEVSDEREVIYHEPHRNNEHVIHNTQALNGNDDDYNGDRLLNYGFVKSGDRYIKKTKKYKIEYYKAVFYLTTYDSSRLSISVDSRQSLIKRSESNGNKTVDVEMPLPSGELNCDNVVCKNTYDYYKYLNLLIRVVRE